MPTGCPPGSPSLADTRSARTMATTTQIVGQANGRLAGFGRRFDGGVARFGAHGVAAVGTSEFSLDRLRWVVAGDEDTVERVVAVRGTFTGCPCVEAIPEAFEWRR